MQITPIVKQLLIINILCYIGAQFVPQAYDFMALYYFDNEKFQYWQLVTHMFMHAKYPNIMHIAFNMFALYSFGSALEHFWGGTKFIFFYITCGLGAAGLQLGINYLELQQVLQPAAYLNLSHAELYQILNAPIIDGNYFKGELLQPVVEKIMATGHPTAQITQEAYSALFQASVQSRGLMVGASGAIYGLLVAFAFMFPNAELMMMFIPIPIKAKYFVPGIIALDLILGLSSSYYGNGGGGIAHYAHVGGALFGVIMMLYWRKNQFKHNRWN